MGRTAGHTHERCVAQSESSVCFAAPSPGCILVPIVDQREYLAKFPAAFEAVKDGEPQLGRLLLGGPLSPAPLELAKFPLPAAEFDLPAIQAFFDSIDYVGLSAYIPQSNIRFEVQRGAVGQLQWAQQQWQWAPDPVQLHGCMPEVNEAAPSCISCTRCCCCPPLLPPSPCSPASWRA